MPHRWYVTTAAKDFSIIAEALNVSSNGTLVFYTLEDPAVPHSQLVVKMAFPLGQYLRCVLDD